MHKALIFWGAGVAALTTALVKHQSTPGLGGVSPRQWPDETFIHRHADRHTLLMFAHPRCPCTRASISELSRFMTHGLGRLDVSVLFVESERDHADGEDSDNLRDAAAIPAIQVVHDVNGLNALRFGVRTSGQVLLYDPSGVLVFEGGITPSRGHEGDSAGASAIVAIMKGDTPRQSSTPVFGCPLFDGSLAEPAHTTSEGRRNES